MSAALLNSPPAPLLRFDNIHFSPEKNAAPLFTAFNLNLESGAPSVLIGPNGAGKTSLLKLGMGLLMPTSGEIFIHGTPRAESEDCCAMLLQRPVMLRRSVTENILYATSRALSEAEKREKLETLLHLIGLEGFAARPARALSGGEQQRVAIARALARDPKILFLDEPTANLDPASSLRIEMIIEAAQKQGVKIIFSSHDLAQAKRLAGEVIFLHHGAIIEQTAADVFFHNPKTLLAAEFQMGKILL